MTTVASPLDLFRRTVTDTPDAPAVRYFDGVLTYRELDALSNTAAATRTAHPSSMSPSPISTSP
jgi:non-ribosomal peptide synthetase component F